MSLWWVQKEQLDRYQMELIETLPLRENVLILGPPGSGKTNVLVRRAQFVRGQNMPNVLLLTFTRPLAEFVRTGCSDTQGREIFPRSCVTTLESWQRQLYHEHGKSLPSVVPGGDSLTEWKRQLSLGALEFFDQHRKPPYDALFVDEAQDLLDEEVSLLAQWSRVLCFVGDDRQRIYAGSAQQGLAAVRRLVPHLQERMLPFHYRLAPEICAVADRILQTQGGGTLTSTAHYNGPKPGRVSVERQSLPKEGQLANSAARLKEQIRVYGDLIRQGDRLGVIVALKSDRDAAFDFFERDPQLNGKSKIIRARDSSDDEYDPSFDPEAPICILTVKGVKGLEFRAAHWLFSDELSYFHTLEHYYTVVTRAKTSLDISYTDELPQAIARAHSEDGVSPW